MWSDLAKSTTLQSHAIKQSTTKARQNQRIDTNIEQLSMPSTIINESSTPKSPEKLPNNNLPAELV